MITFSICLAGALIIAYLFKWFYKSPVNHCPYCYHDIKLKGLVIICPICKGTLKFGSDSFYHATTAKNILIFEDPTFNSDFLLLTPPNKIEVPKDLSFQEKVAMIANTLDMTLFTMSTKVDIGPYSCFPQIVVINGRIKYVVNGFDPKRVPSVPWANISFYIGYNS